jgi:hypothetical protein
MRRRALDKLIHDTPLTYKSQALEVIDIDYGGKGYGHTECTKDGEMAVSAAILYWATKKQEYADMALDILRAWANTNNVWKGNNGLLEASWCVCALARAAELLKHAPVHGWNIIEGRFFGWLDTVIMPLLKSESIWRWNLIGNWHFSQLCARMQLAILREDSSEFAWCIAKYPLALKAALPFKKCTGENSETCRDVTHSMFNLGGMSQFAELAYHQGVNVYDHRLVDAFELQARIMMKEIPSGLVQTDIKTPYGYWYEPVWHIAHAHFTQRCKIPMPKTDAYIQTISPDRVCFHWGPNCLTHFERAGP